MSETIIVWSVIAGWVLCGVLAYGIIFAYFRGEDIEYGLRSNKLEVRQERAMAFLAALFGPLGLAASYIVSGFAYYGLRWK